MDKLKTKIQNTPHRGSAVARGKAQTYFVSSSAVAGQPEKQTLESRPRPRANNLRIHASVGGGAALGEQFQGFAISNIRRVALDKIQSVHGVLVSPGRGKVDREDELVSYGRYKSRSSSEEEAPTPNRAIPEAHPEDLAASELRLALEARGPERGKSRQSAGEEARPKTHNPRSFSSERSRIYDPMRIKHLVQNRRAVNLYHYSPGNASEQSVGTDGCFAERAASRNPAPRDAPKEPPEPAESRPSALLDLQHSTESLSEAPDLEQKGQPPVFECKPR